MKQLQHRILLVEDDYAIRDMIVQYLEKENFLVQYAKDGEEAIILFQQESFDLILLDLMLPHLNGMEFLKMIREDSTLPVLIISAKDNDADKAIGLGFGADDYITKPFSMIELSARVKATIRRAYTYSPQAKIQTPNLLTNHDITLDLENMRAYKNESEIKLTSKEWEIMKLFLLTPKKSLQKNKSIVPFGMKPIMVMKMSSMCICDGSGKRLKMTPPHPNIFKHYGASVIN